MSAFYKLCTSFIIILVFAPYVSYAQIDSWYPPENGPETMDVPPPLNTSTNTQIMQAAFAVDLKGTLSSLPFGTGFLVRAGSIFLEKTGLGILSSWIPSSLYAIDTNAPIRGNGVHTSLDIISLPFRTGYTTESTICADVATGILKKCTPPALTFTATPTTTSATGNTLTWSSTATTTCTSPDFATNDKTSGTALVKPAAVTTYTITCTGIGGSITKSLTIKGAAPAVSIKVTSPQAIPFMGGLVGNIIIPEGAPAVLTWTCAGEAIVSSTPNNFANGVLNGSATVYPTTSTQYSLSCGGPSSATGGTSVTVQVTGPDPVPYLSVTPASIATAPTTVKIEWDCGPENRITTSTTSFSTTGWLAGITTKSQSATTTYTLICRSYSGVQTTKSVTVPLQ